MTDVAGDMRWNKKWVCSAYLKTENIRALPHNISLCCQIYIVLFLFRNILTLNYKGWAALSHLYIGVLFI